MRAQVVPYSSVVGSSIIILDDHGHVSCVLAVNVQGRGEEHKAKSQGIALLVSDALNAMASVKNTDQLLKFNEKRDPQPYLFIEGSKVIARGKFFNGKEAVGACDELYPDATAAMVVINQKHDTITAPINGVEQVYYNRKLLERNQS